MKNQTPATLAKRIIHVLASSRFFWAIIVLFLIQASWIALTGRYPMAFDEGFHLGVIKIYAENLSPFLNATPPGSQVFGALVSDPSYLFHYVMSFPYRFIVLFTDNLTIQVLFLRAINIAMFAYGLVLFRKVLLRATKSRAVVHASILVFVLLPIVPLLAAQINYDNVLLPLVAICLLLTLNIYDTLKKSGRLDIKSLLILGSICLLTSLVKYAFLPIFIAIVVFLIVNFFKSFAGWSAFWSSLVAGFQVLSVRVRWALAVLVFVSLGLFAQRYFVNIVEYRTPVPDCSQVLSVEACMEYGPWGRDYRYSQNKLDAPTDPISFADDWFYGMWMRTFFAVDGPGTRFQTGGPLLIPGLASILLIVAAVLASIFKMKAIFRTYNAAAISLFLAVSGSYIGALWLNGYKSFVETTRPVAINGRYLLIIMMPIILIGGLAFAQWLKQRAGYKVTLLVFTVLSLAWGGGALTYILRSNEGWYWPAPIVRTVNETTQDILGPIVPGYEKRNQFMR